MRKISRSQAAKLSKTALLDHVDSLEAGLELAREEWRRQHARIAELQDALNIELCDVAFEPVAGSLEDGEVTWAEPATEDDITADEADEALDPSEVPS